jgi:glycosyltransferase involved in cell wall biosynthesis
MMMQNSIQSAFYAKLLLITHESVSEKMAGPSIRAWELARALGAHGVPVILATPFPSMRSSENVEIRQFSWENADSLISLIDLADAVMAIGPVLARVVHVLGAPVSKPTIVDVYYVPEIEQVMLELSSQRYDFDMTQVYLDDLSVYLHQGDFFVCALEKQYDFWLGALLASGRINAKNLGRNYSVNRLIDLVPMGIPDDPPAIISEQQKFKGIVPGINEKDKVLYWGGGIWEWMDPIILMEALKLINQERDDVRVVFGALQHYDHSIVARMTVSDRLMDWIDRENWLGKYIFFQDWIPYDLRGSYLLDADLGVSLSVETMESRYAIRARLLDCLWASLPCVLTRGDEIASRLETYGLAKLITPGDVSGLAQAILSMLDTGVREAGRTRAAPYLADMKWSNVVQPLLNYLHHPYLADDAQNARESMKDLIPLRRQWEELRLEVERSKSEIKMLRQRKVVRMADFIGTRIARLKGSDHD